MGKYRIRVRHKRRVGCKVRVRYVQACGLDPRLGLGSEIRVRKKGIGEGRWVGAIINVDLGNWVLRIGHRNSLLSEKDVTERDRNRNQRYIKKKRKETERGRETEKQRYKTERSNKKNEV